MLNKLFEWYRVVNADPTDDVIAKRKASASELIDRIAKESHDKLFVPCVAAAVCGMECAFDQKQELVSLLVELIRKQQPAFPENLSENALELRVLCAVAVGELLSRSSAQQTESAALLAASLIISGIRLHEPTKAKYLQQMLQDLNKLAIVLTERGYLERRSRNPFNFDAFDELPAATLPAFWQGFLPAFKSCVQHFEAQAAADREELDVLWWMYTGFSETAGESLVKLDHGAVALCCGGEIANLVITPPAQSSREMVKRSIRDTIPQASSTQVTLKKLMAASGTKPLGLLSSDAPAAKKAIQRFPSLFPISWVCNRLRESEGVGDWGKEFTGKTGVADNRQMLLEEWGVQVFNERIAQRVYLKVLEP